MTVTNIMLACIAAGLFQIANVLSHLHIDVHVKSKTIVVSKKEYEMEVKGHEIE